MGHRGGEGHLNESKHQLSLGVEVCHQKIKQHKIGKVKTLDSLFLVIFLVVVMMNWQMAMLLSWIPRKKYSQLKQGWLPDWFSRLKESQFRQHQAAIFRLFKDKLHQAKEDIENKNELKLQVLNLPGPCLIGFKLESVVGLKVALRVIKVQTKLRYRFVLEDFELEYTERVGKIKCRRFTSRNKQIWKMLQLRRYMRTKLI